MPTPEQRTRSLDDAAHASIQQRLLDRIRWGLLNGSGIEAANVPPAVLQWLQVRVSADEGTDTSPSIQSLAWTIRGRYADGSTALRSTTLPS